MRKMFKSKKALSPVVAAIILIAVTVAVSIAVAAWMGALTFTFMKTEELKVTNMAFTDGTTSGTTITLTIQNPGTSQVTVSSVKINDVAVTTTSPSLPVPYAAGASAQSLVLTSSWSAGNKYKVTLLSATGTPVAAYEATA
jgi:flagellin-like protein